MALSVHITFSEAFMRYFNNFDAFMKLVLSMTGGFYNTLIIFFFTLLFSLARIRLSVTGVMPRKVATSFICLTFWRFG